ncbi:MAG: FIST C-terminal domain-containing protein [Bacteroidetes bacterium]|nr:FIST C-terminal domain-containing protein [Bacteroidota bacterium]
MEVRTFSTNSVKEFRQTWEINTSDGFSANAAVIFSSIELDRNEIIQFLQPMGVRVFGCTSCGEFLYDSEGKTISEGGLVCSMLLLKPGSFNLRLFSGQGLSSFYLGKKAGEWAANEYKDPAVLVVASGLTIDGEQLVHGIQEAAGQDIIMYGGLAGDDAHFKETAVFTEDNSDTNGAVLMVFDKSVYNIQGIATSGWVSIGADKVITHSEGNVVYTIDNEPALDVYKHYLNVNDEDLPEIGVEYPLLIRKKEPDFILRAVLNVDREKKALIFAGTVPNGAVVTFSSSPGFEIVDFTKKKVNEFFESNPATDLLILFSCMARHNALGPTISEEIEEAWMKWKKPLIGFFTYGEIGNNYRNSCDFYNQTFTLVSLKQK